MECKSKKSRDTWRTDTVGLGVQNETRQRLTEFCQENTLVIANTLFQQHKRRLYTCTSPDGQYQNQIDYILCSQRWRNSIQSAKTRLGADCGSEKKARESQESTYFCFIDCVKAFDHADHNKLWKILQEMGIPDH